MDRFLSVSFSTLFYSVHDLKCIYLKSGHNSMMLGTVSDLLVKLSLSSAQPTRRSYFSKLPEQIKANMLTITVSITLSISIDDTRSQPLSARQQKPSRRASLADFFGSLTNLIKGKLGLKEEHCRLQHPQGNEVRMKFV